MAKGYTYFCTDGHGNTYSRYSALHLRPEYPFATVFRINGDTAPAGKAAVSYSSRRELAIDAVRSRCKRANDYLARTRGEGKSMHWVYELMETRAYPGRHKVEPITA